MDIDHGVDDDVIVSLIQNYHELNANVVDELQQRPSALQFLRYVAVNRPFVVRRGAKDWTAVKQWNSSYLRDRLQDTKVRVAVTPKGNADAVVQVDDGRLLFVEPHEVYEPFDSFLQYIQEDDGGDSDKQVKYAQPQNDSLRSEYAVLFDEVPPTVDFASEALDKDVDAVNFWLGNARSTTSLHKDNYENIYIQIRGTKHFTMLPPIEQACVNETPLRFARYKPVPANEKLLKPMVNEGEELIPVPLWDPDEPHVRQTSFSQHSRPITVTLGEGDMFYLPAMWYHKVKQGNGAEGFSCSVNYWYDMEFSGSFWTSNAFIRDVYNSQVKRQKLQD